MNKSELSEKVAQKAGISKADAAKSVDAVSEAITEELQRGGEVQIVGFGKFGVSHRPARQGTNPATGEAVDIKASKSPSFKAGRPLKDALN